MRLAEALALIARARSEAKGEPVRAYLATGPTPLHLQTFLEAELASRLPGRALALGTGQFGDLGGNVQRAAALGVDHCIVCVEWSDLDPRLGLRATGGWDPAGLEDVTRTAAAQGERLASAVADAATKTAVTLSLPTLPPAPLFMTRPSQLGGAEVRLQEVAATLARRCAETPGVRVLNPARLDRLSPHAERADVNSEIRTGFPYSRAHASHLAALLADLALPPAPKKGVITDLDDTCWLGLVGEVGAENVSWNMECGSQGHALYQQALNSLAQTGVLVAVASKNEQETAERALARQDMLLRRENVYPVIASWGAKSASVASVLRAWNVGEDSVVFVDDSPIELAEVQASFPGVTCLRFPRGDDAAILALIGTLRDLCGKSGVSDEDRLRARSLRQAAEFERVRDEGAGADDFLKTIDPELTVSFARDPDDARPLELINKTNQFNLNGRRIGEAEWHRFLADPGSVLLTVSYADKFGPLGKIGVLGGTVRDRALHLDAWVLSCRAFARRIEHAMLQRLFDRFDVDAVVLAFEPTARNSPVREFLESLGLTPQGGSIAISRAAFAAACPALYHRIVESTDE